MEPLKEQYIRNINESKFIKSLIDKSFRYKSSTLVNRRAIGLYYSSTSLIGKSDFIKISPKNTLWREFSSYIKLLNTDDRYLEDENNIDIAVVRFRIFNDLQFLHRYLSWYSQWENCSRSDIEGMAIILAFSRSIQWSRWYFRSGEPWPVYLRILKELPIGNLHSIRSQEILDSPNFKSYLNTINPDHERGYSFSMDSNLGKRRELSEIQKLILLYITACYKKEQFGRNYYIEAEILSNIIDDNPHVEIDSLFYIAEHTVAGYLYDKSNKIYKEKIRKRLLKENGIQLFGKVFERICISSLKLNFYDATDGVLIEEKTLLTVYDQTTKYILSVDYHAPNSDLLKNILKAIIVTNNNVISKEILLDPSLLYRFRFAIKPLREAGVRIVLGKPINKRLVRFLRFFKNRIPDDPMKFYFGLTGLDSEFNVFLDIKPDDGIYDYESVINSIPRLLETEFNQSDRYRELALTSPKECFKELKKADLISITAFQFAQLFYDRHTCIVLRDYGFLLCQGMAYYFRFINKVKCSEAVRVMLCNLKDPATVFVKIEREWKEAKVMQKFSSEDDLEKLLKDGPASEIINVRSEIQDAKRLLLNAPKREKSIFNEDASRLLRKQMRFKYE